MLDPETELQLTIPEQSLATLSFSEAKPGALSQWVQNLPMANIGETARQLYQAVIELSQLVSTPQVRSQLLEILREPIYYVCQELSKHFLNHAITLPEKQQKVVNLAHALQLRLAIGYKAVMMDSISNLNQEKTRKTFACAAHRMMSEYGQVILRSYQLYNSAPKDLWREMHAVFSFCERKSLFKYVIHDQLNKSCVDTRIDQAYKRNLLLSCSRPNQLRQNDIASVYEAFAVWSEYVEVGSDYSSNAVFVINMEQDQPPKYRCLLHDNLNDYFYGFDTAELVSRLTNYLSALHQKNDDASIHLTMPVQLSETVINHLHHSLGILTKRTFKRISSSGSTEICIGLSASHYYTSGEVNFHVQLMNKPQSDDENIFLSQSRQKNDAWSDAFDAGGMRGALGDAEISFSRPVGKDGVDAYPKFNIPLVNMSPGGFCLQWNEDVPSNVQAGEIVSLREDEKQPWSIGVIRWIRHLKQKGTQIGIELLAPNTTPCGVQLLNKTGAPSEFMRGLLLPEISSIGQPATLITPRVPFNSGNKVAIRANDSESKCQLEQRLAVTASFSQFELSQKLSLIDDKDQTKDTHTQDDAEDDFDSLWPSL